MRFRTAILTCLFLLLAGHAKAQTYQLIFPAAQQFFDDNGDPLAGGKICTYAAGTTNNQATYTDSTGGTQHTNPIILDAAGRPTGGDIWGGALPYKIAIDYSTGDCSSPIRTTDNVTGSASLGLTCTACVSDAEIDATGITTRTKLPTAIAYEDTANTWTTGAQDMSAATSFKTPVTAGAAPTASGLLHYDDTAKDLEYGDNGTNRKVANLDEAQTLSNKTFSDNLVTQSGTAFSLTFDHAITQNRQITIPDLNGTLAFLDNAQTFTGAKTFNGNNTYAGTSTFSGVIQSGATFTGTTFVKNLNAVRFADQFTGSDACAKIAAAIADLPSSGGTVDARGFQGAQTCAADPLDSNANNVKLLLGATTITSAVAWGSTSTGTVHIQGNGHRGTDATIIAFSGATAGIVPGSDGWSISDLVLDGNGSTSTYGIVLGGASSRSLFTCEDSVIQDWERGLSMTAASIDNNFYNCDFNQSYGANGYGIYVAGTTGTADFPTTTRFIGGRVQDNNAAGAYVGLSRGVIFDKFLFNSNTGDGLRLGVTAAESAEDVSITQSWFEENGTAPAGTNFDIKAQRVLGLSIKDTNFGSALATPLRVYRNANLGANDAERVMVQGGQFLAANPVILDSSVQGVQLLNTGLLEALLLTDSAADTLVIERDKIRKGGASTLRTILTTDKYGILTLDTGSTANAQGLDFTKAAASFTGPMAAIRGRATNYGINSAGLLEFATNAGTEATPSVRMTLDATGLLNVSKNTDTRIRITDEGTAGSRSAGLEFYGDFGAGSVKSGDIIVSHNGGTFTLGSRSSSIDTMVFRTANADQIAIGSTGALLFGGASGDTNLYRGAASVLKTDDSLTYLRHYPASIVSFANGDTSPTVGGSTVFKTANVGATTITTFDDGAAGQVITIVFTDTNTTVSEASNIKLSAAFTSTADDTMTLVFDGTNWYETARAVN